MFMESGHNVQSSYIAIFLVYTRMDRELGKIWDRQVFTRYCDFYIDGLATLLISADLDELIGLSDTIVVMFRGKLVATLDPNDVTPRDLGAFMTGAHLGDEHTPTINQAVQQ